MWNGIVYGVGICAIEFTVNVEQNGRQGNFRGRTMEYLEQAAVNINRLLSEKVEDMVGRETSRVWYFVKV